MELEEVEQELHPFRQWDLPGVEQRPGQRVERAPASAARVFLHPVGPPAVFGYPAASAERAGLGGGEVDERDLVGGWLGMLRFVPFPRRAADQPFLGHFLG